MEDNVIILGAKHLTNIDYWLKVRIKDILKYDEIKEVVEPTKIIDEDYKEEPKKDSRLTIKVREIYNVNCSSCARAREKCKQQHKRVGDSGFSDTIRDHGIYLRLEGFLKCSISPPVGSMVCFLMNWDQSTRQSNQDSRFYLSNGITSLRRRFYS